MDFATVKASLSKQDTADLLKIWVEHDTEAWTDNAFQAIHEILTERGQPLPAFGGQAAQRIRDERAAATETKAREGRQKAASLTQPTAIMRYLLALLACGGVIIVYAVIAALIGWKHGGGYLPMVLLLVALAATWRAITKRRNDPKDIHRQV